MEALASVVMMLVGLMISLTILAFRHAIMMLMVAVSIVRIVRQGSRRSRRTRL